LTIGRRVAARLAALPYSLRVDDPVLLLLLGRHQFNELQIADDMKKSGGYIPGVRPGQATSDYLHRTMSRITLAGAIFLTIIAVIPIILGEAMNIPQNVANFFGARAC